MAHTCPICSYPQLKEPPRGKSGGGSYEICPSCGFQFGVDDDDRGISFDQWRKDWIKRGRPWSSQSIAPPGEPATPVAKKKSKPVRKSPKKKPGKG